MKTIKMLFIGALMLLASFRGSAQLQSSTEPFLTDQPYPIGGDYKYSYITKENGTKSLEGQFTMIGQAKLSIDYKTFWTATITGTYNLKGSHKNNAIHGPINLTSQINANATNGDSSTYTYSLKGNFNEGYPEGNFVVSYDVNNKEYVNVNYKNGKLVGSYQAKGFDEYNSRGFDYKGTISSDGKMTGSWKLNDETLVFQNGVRVSNYSGDLNAKAQQYAAGTLSESALNKEDIYVVTDSIALGYYAWSVILRDDVICWDKLGGYAFGQSKNVYYKYLQKLPSFTDEGFTIFKNDFLAYSLDPELEFMCKYQGGRIEPAIYNNRIDFDERYNLYYCEINQKWKYATYCKGYPDWSAGAGLAKIYFTNEQISEIEKALHEQRKAHPISAKDLLSRLYRGNSEVDYYVQNGVLDPNGDYDREYDNLVDEGEFIRCELDRNFYVFLDFYTSFNGIAQYVDYESWFEFAILTGHEKDLLKDATEEDKLKINDIKQKIAELKKQEQELKRQEQERAAAEPIPYELADVKPLFQGGDATMFSRWVNSRLEYPETAKANNIQGRVMLQITIEKDGTVTNVKVLRGLDPELDKEAVRVVSMSPKWVPARKGNQEVPVNYTCIAIFRM